MICIYIILSFIKDLKFAYSWDWYAYFFLHKKSSLDWIFDTLGEHHQQFQSWLILWFYYSHYGSSQKYSVQSDRSILTIIADIENSVLTPNQNSLNNFSNEIETS